VQRAEHIHAHLHRERKGQGVWTSMGECARLDKAPVPPYCGLTKTSIVCSPGVTDATHEKVVGPSPRSRNAAQPPSPAGRRRTS
jgi:hypothetical protein